MNAGDQGKRKRALVIEGGGMRGAYAVGVLKILHDYGGADLFDHIYAVSSGVYAATFFTAGQVKEMESTWDNYVHNSQLIKYGNCLRCRPILDVDRLIRLFRGPESYLDLDRLLGAQPALTYVLTDFATGRPAYFDAKRLAIFDLMRASSAIPWFYPRVRIEGRLYFDGGVSDALPVQQAINDGYWDIVVVATSPADRTTQRVGVLASLPLWRSRRARQALMASHLPYDQALALAKAPPPGVRALLVRPTSMKISRFSRERQRIRLTIEQGMQDAEHLVRQFPAWLTEAR
jgi:predicted patatin/cPLA2 family phospholipase